MSKNQITGAAIETLNARREELVNQHGIQRAQKLVEWRKIDAELQARKTYEFYESRLWAYTQHVVQYQPSPYASDGQ